MIKKICDECRQEPTEGNPCVFEGRLRVKLLRQSSEEPGYIEISLSAMEPGSDNVDEEASLCLQCFIKAVKEGRIEFQEYEE